MSMHIIGYEEIEQILAGREHDVIQAVADAHMIHEDGDTAVPHSTFLRFPTAADGQPSKNRFIGLPAYVGGDMSAAGMKWIASFPENIEHGLNRANAVVVMNSPETGLPETLLEGSLISAARTAAGAALAVDLLLPAESDISKGMTLIGCGVINETILRYVKSIRPGLTTITVYDQSRERAEEFSRRCTKTHTDVDVTVVTDLDQAVGRHQLISIATTAGEPHMDLEAAQPGAVVLHVSLRDLTARTILDCHNVTDDADHVCRERTSLHLAEQVAGGRHFIDARLGELITGGTSLPTGTGKATVYSPFGLGILDLAVARMVRDHAVASGRGTKVESFLPKR